MIDFHGGMIPEVIEHTLTMVRFALQVIALEDSAAMVNDYWCILWDGNVKVVKRPILRRRHQC